MCIRDSNKEIGQTVISCYKRASNILNHELREQKLELSDSTDPGLFKNEFEKNLYNKIHDLRKYFTSSGRDENYEISLGNLAESKNIIFDFFDITNPGKVAVCRTKSEMMPSNYKLAIQYAEAITPRSVILSVC